MSLPVSLALLEPPPAGSQSSWLDPWINRPEFLLPIGFGVLMLLVVLCLKGRDLPSRWRARGKSTLAPDQLEELMLGTPPNILDIRSEPEYRGERGHIRNAVNIPFAQLQQRLDELDTSHPRPIVLVDEDDTLSHQAFSLVAARGHTWLYVLRGGMKAWRRAKLPTYQFQGKPRR
jgi:3-mercaptopyruvate sulfurtransferase SseA